MSRRAGGAPPRMAQALLGLLLPGRGIRESVLGDLHELYLERARTDGPGKARLWYWAQALWVGGGYAFRRLRGSRHQGWSPAPTPRDVRKEPLTDFARQLRFSLRSLIRSPGFTVPALLILSVGMTAATAIFTVVDSIAFRPLDYVESERLVLVCEDHPQMRGACVSSPGNAADFRARATTLSELGIGRGWAFSITDEGGRAPLRGGLATGSFFTALGVSPHLGRVFSADEVGPDNGRVVVLSHALWTTRYGADPTTIGRTVTVGGAPHVIVGVLPADFEAPLDLDGIEAWRPPDFDLLDPEVRGWRGWRAVGRLAPGLSREASVEELSGIYAGLAEVHAEINDEWRIQVRPLMDVVVGDTRAVLYAFLGAAGLLLAIVCANVANLLLARGLGRRREFAVRAALGAERRRLVAEILTESMVLTTLATVLAIALAKGSTQLLLLLAPPEIPRLDEVTVDGRILAFAAAASVLATAAFAVIPALRVTAWDLGQTLKSGSGSGRRDSSSRLRGGLVVAELALSVVLLASAAVLTRSFAEYMEWDPGFDRESLVTFSAFMAPEKYPTRNDLSPFYREAEQVLTAVPGVTRAASASAGPLFGGGDGSSQFAVRGWDRTVALPSALWYDVGPGYFATLGARVVRGREFLESDQTGSVSVVVVNEAFAALAWPGLEALGQLLDVPDRELSMEVVGVVADTPPLEPGRAVAPEMYWPNRQRGRWGTFFVLRSEGDPGAVGAAASEALMALDPDLTLGSPRTLASSEARALLRPRFQAVVLLVFALAALALSAVGVYAVVSYAVQRRIREMGIRVALGADSADVMALVMRSSLGVSLLGLGLGLVGAVGTGRLLRGVVHGVSPTDPVSLGGSLLLLLVAAAVAAFVPARRATRADPLVAIRAD